jgi:hypothetical protein
VCVPGGGLDEPFAGRPSEQRQAYDRVIRHLRSLGPLHEDAVSVGVFLKASRTVAEARPRARGLALVLWLPRRVEDPRITRVLAVRGRRVAHQLVLRTAADVDEVVLGWLDEAYTAAED